MQRGNYQSKSYKDLIKQNSRLNAELRKVSFEGKRVRYNSEIFVQTPTQKLNKISNISDRVLQKKKQDELKHIKAQMALKNLGNSIKQKGLRNQDNLNVSSKKSKTLLTSLSVDKNNSNKYEVNSPENQQLKKHLIQQKKSSNYINKFSSLDLNNSTKAHALLRNSQLISASHHQVPKFELHHKHFDYHANNYSLGTTNLEQLSKDKKKLLRWIRQNIIGFNTSYTSAVNLPIQTIYVDHTATNRPFKAVQILVEHAKLFAANPHTQFSRYGKFSTELMHYARDSLLRSFSAPKNQYTVLPTGGGSTGAIQKAVHFLKGLENNNQVWKNPAVFLTPYEHHSNILPWVEFYQKIQILAHSSAGTLQMDKIYEQLSTCPSEGIIVTVSAASNVTSKLTHIKQLNQVIKKIRGETKKKIVFAMDCAAFCCHHDLNLSIYDQIDFAFLSPHKNLGGAESCGILVARQSLMNAGKPTFPGGGTVRFVKGYSKNDVMYQVDIFSRQIAGTPPYLGFYRAALSFQLLKNVIGYDFIHEKERRNTELFFNMINQANESMKAQGHDMVINIYGQKDLNERANVITFNYQYGNFRFIQHSFASLILTDIFGIQIRSGCFCAGPYGINLLHIKEQMINRIQQEVQAGILINKPGYLRLDLTFYLKEYEIQYIAKAIILIARYYKNLQKLYTVCNHGEVILLPIFTKKHSNEKQIYSLSQIQEANKKIKEQSETHQKKLKNRRQTLLKQLRIGETIAKNPMDFIKKVKCGEHLNMGQQK